MRNLVVFPHVLTAITVGRVKSIAAVEHALHSSAPLGLILQKDAAIDEPGLDALFNMGTIINIVRTSRRPMGCVTPYVRVWSGFA